MTRSQKRPEYAWGTKAPGQRLRDTSERLRKSLDDASGRSFPEIPKRVGAVVKDSRSLLDALEHLSKVGYRPKQKSTPLTRDEIQTVTEGVHVAVGDLASASILDATERYRELQSALEALLELGEEVMTRGVVGSGAPVPQDPWGAFEA